MVLRIKGFGQFADLTGARKRGWCFCGRGGRGWYTNAHYVLSKLSYADPSLIQFCLKGNNKSKSASKRVF